jgi:hypothetical protein
MQQSPDKAALVCALAKSFEESGEDLAGDVASLGFDLPP